MEIRFRIYYSDREPYTGDPFFAPSTGVQVVVQSNPGVGRGFKVMNKHDAYYWKPDCGWCNCDMAGLWDYLLMYLGPKAVLFGRSVRDDMFWTIVERASNEGLG